MAGRFAKGTGLYAGDGASPEVFTKISDVKSITGPGFNVTIIDTTTHSTVGNYREKAAVLIDPGKLQFNVNFNPDDPTLDPTASDTLFMTLQNLEEKNFELRLAPSNPGNQKMSFKGFVTAHSFTFPVDNVQEAQIQIEIDGPITWS